MEKSLEMRPTKRTLFFRKCFSFQFLLFVGLNVKIVKAALFPPKH